MVHAGEAPFSPFSPTYHINNAPPIIGLTAHIGACFFGAWIGQAIRHRRA